MKLCRTLAVLLEKTTAARKNPGWKADSIPNETSKTNLGQYPILFGDLDTLCGCATKHSGANDSRYHIGFRSPVRDGKPHTLEIKLTKNAKRKYKFALLRNRHEYVPD
jgi:hypothetical protein